MLLTANESQSNRTREEIKNENIKIMVYVRLLYRNKIFVFDINTNNCFHLTEKKKRYKNWLIII